MNETLVNKIRQCATLPSLPTIALQVLELAQKDEVDIAEIARIISKDVALSSKILRTVNSSFYGRSQSVSTISHALVILGLQSVKTLVLGFSLVSNLTKTKAKGFKHITYWRRSIYAATAARTIAIKLRLVQQEECFLSALMGDVGMLVLDQVAEETYAEINELAPSHALLAAVEQEVLGLTHADAGAILAQQWKLPPLLSTPISFHHRPQDVQEPTLRKMVEVVHLAGISADVFVDEKAAPAIAAFRNFCRDRYQFADADSDKLLEDIGQRTREVAPLFEISLGNNANFESILKRANEALVEMTLKTQQQAVVLEEQNVKLKQQATTDGLTGLANRATFDAFLSEQFSAAKALSQPLSLIMLDVDKFKSVNDKYGHQTGDRVLAWLSKLLKSAARAQDMAARYGGEEMVLVLPGTPRQTATAIAESIRRAVAAKPVNVQTTTLPITASFGVATYEQGSPLSAPEHLLKAADMGVYAAKAGGRNCVKVFALKPKAA